MSRIDISKMDPESREAIRAAFAHGREVEVVDGDRVAAVLLPVAQEDDGPRYPRTDAERAELDAKLAEAIREADAGELVPLEEVVADIEERYGL